MIGSFIEKLLPLSKNNSPQIQKLWGIILVVIVVSVVSTSLFQLQIVIDNLSVLTMVIFLMTVAVGGLLLKTTIAIRSMEKHAIDIMDDVEKYDIDIDRKKLELILKRNTKNLDKNHFL